MSNYEDHSDVIDWDEAMEQVGGDEDFLHELLGDLQEELNTQLRKIQVAMVSARKKLLFPFLIIYSTSERRPAVACVACCSSLALRPCINCYL